MQDKPARTDAPGWTVRGGPDFLVGLLSVRPCPVSTRSTTWHSFVATLQLASTISGVPAERVRLRIGNLAKAVLVSGQAYQDPMDALNEFVSNAPPSDPVSPAAPSENEQSSPSGSSRPPTVLPDPNPGEVRSRFDPDVGVVFFNDTHPDYLLVKDSEPMLLDYLTTLVTKEYVVYNNPRAEPQEIGGELIRMLVRVRRHIPKRSS